MLAAHLADVHLGRRSPGDPQGAERLNSFRQAVAALAAAADVLLLAGDTFDGPLVEGAVIAEAARCLAGVRGSGGNVVPVVIIPGNHDPADADKLWRTFHEALGGDAHVRVLREPGVVRLLDGKLLVEAYPCMTRFSAEPPWEKRLPAAATRGDGVRIVMAHGTLQGGPVPDGETDAYPFTQADVEALGADYVALGHFHGLYPAWGDGDECTRAFGYCGTHEPDQYSGDSGYAILATVEAGQPTRLQRVKTGRRQWRQLLLNGPGDLANLEKLEAEAKAGDPSRFVIRLKIEGGVWAGQDVARLESLEAALGAVGAQVERRGILRARVQVEAIDLQALPTGAVKETLLSLRGELEQTTDEGRRAVLGAALQLGWEKTVGHV